MAFENEIRTTPSLLKKRIKKIQRKTGSEDKLQIAVKEQERANSKAKKELFNGVNERKKRRVKKSEFLNLKFFSGTIKEEASFE